MGGCCVSRAAAQVAKKLAAVKEVWGGLGGFRRAVKARYRFDCRNVAAWTPPLYIERSHAAAPCVGDGIT